jgi:hypothetical protein
MNYVLNLQLEGAEQINSALDGLLKKVGGIGSGTGGKIDFAEWLGAGQSELSQIEGDGEKAAGSFAKGAEKKLKSFNIFDAWGKSRLKEMQDFWNDAIKAGKENLGGKQAGKFEAMELLGRQGGSIPKVNFSEMENNLAKLAMEDFSTNKRNDANKPQGGTIKEYVVAGLATFFNPFIGARAFENIGRGKSGKGMLGSESYVRNFVLIKAAGMAFTSLINAVKKTTQAYDDARKLYAKSLMSGLGVGFTTKRQNLAEILGVHELEVIRFGKALEYLAPKLQFANDTMAKTNKELTGVGWEFAILGKNLQAIWNIVANAMSPAFMAFAQNMNAFLESLGKTDFIAGVAGAFNLLFIALNNVVGVIELVIAGFANGMKVIADSIAFVIAKALNLLSKVPGLGGIGGFDTDKILQDIIDSSQSVADLAERVAGNAFGGNAGGGVPTPQSYMKQLPASSWEKMGLVVGGGTNNYAQQTAKNTKDTADAVKFIAKAMGAGGGSSNPFGMNLMTSNA